MNKSQIKEKFYTILLFIDANSSKKIERLRENYIGTNLVDRHLPHMSLKRKFTLTQDFSEKDLIKRIEEFPLLSTPFSISKIKRMGNAITLIGENVLLTKIHKDITKNLEGKICTINPEWEGDNFTPHITLLRDPTSKISLSQKDIKLDKILLDAIGVYEMDPDPAKRFSRELFLKKLDF